MSPERQGEILNALEGINPDESEADLTVYAVAAIIRVLNCSRESALALLNRLRRSGAIRLAVAQPSGPTDDRHPIPQSLFCWRRR
jgi:hypothetical protein